MAQRRTCGDPIDWVLLNFATCKDADDWRSG